MSVSSIQTSIAGIQRDIQSAQRKLTDRTREEAAKTAKIVSVQKSVTKSTSASTLQSKLREIQSLQGDTVRIQNSKADASKLVAEKTQRLHALQQDLFKAQQKDQEAALKKLQRTQDENALAQRRQLERMVFDRSLTSTDSRVSIAVADHDVFISHASEDKDDVVRPLSELLRAKGFDVWYDEFQLRVGDSLRRSIDQGLAKSRFGIVVLSPAFFAKNWPQYELDGLVQREMQGSKVILPIWHKVTKTEVINYSPSLADKLALNTATATLDEIVSQISEVLEE
jgi:TIR domain